MSAGESPFIGIVTVLYNSDEVLPDFFASLAAQEGVRYRLYVIDNGTTDSGTRMSEALAARHGIDAVCVFNDANVGVAKGNNQGIDKALADGCSHVLLANNDTAFGPRTIVTLLEAMRATGQAAATPKIMYHSQPELIWYAGGRTSPWRGYSIHHGDMVVDNGQYDRQGATDYAPTCFMLIECGVFKAVGMMDEAYFVYFDDTDFVWRMKEKGMAILYVPTSVVLHKVSTSTGGSLSPFTMYYVNRNRLYFVLKNFRGMRRLVALAYYVVTRPARLALLPAKTAKQGWRGVRDGIRLSASTLRSADTDH